MTSNRFFLFTDELVPWAIHDESPLPWPDGKYFGEAFAALDRACPDAGLRVVLTDRVTDRLPITGDDVIVICIRDELARMPAYSHDVGLVGKTYGVRRAPNDLDPRSQTLAGLAATLTQEMIVQGRRAPGAFRGAIRTLYRRSRPHVVDLPLGTYLLDDVPFVPFKERSFDVSYAGSRVNRSQEAHRRVPTQKMRSRRELEKSIRQLADERRDWHVGVHIIDTFTDASTNSDVYSKMLMDSRITLCPRGGSLETYRFFEALRSGSVPVTEHLPARDFYTGAPAIRVRCWSDLPKVLDPLIGDQKRLYTMHESVMRWWTERCSPAAIARRLLGSMGLPIGSMLLPEQVSCPPFGNVLDLSRSSRRADSETRR